MLVDNVVKGFPSHETDKVKAAVENLIRDGVLVPHPTKHGASVFLNRSIQGPLGDRIREHKAFAWLK